MKKLFFLIVFSTISLMLVAQSNVTFKASAPAAVVMGEQFRLTFTVNAEGRELRAPQISGFDILMGPSTSTSISSSMINGNINSQVTNSFTYILMPKKEGTFNIAPATIKVKGSNYTSNALAIKVLPAGQTDNNTNGSNNAGNSNPSSATSINSKTLFMQMQVSKRNVYEQEGILVTFKLYSLFDCGLGNTIKFPEFDGFLSQEIDLPNKQWMLENYKGKNYRTVVLKQTVLYAQRTGKINIASGQFEVVVRVPSGKKARSIFDDFFDSYQDVPKMLSSASATINVKPLPSGKPASFTGAVGDFKMTSSINKTSLKANEAVTIKLNITGNGNLKLLKNPEVLFPNDFEIYDPKVDINTTTSTSGVSGTKTVEYMAIPRFAGDFTIPSVAFSFFDIKSKAYKTIKTESYTLDVLEGEGGSATQSQPVISNYSNKESLKILANDVRYLKVKDIQFLIKSEMFFDSFVYWMCYVVPFLFFIIFFIMYRKQIKENSDVAFVRTKKANKVAIKRLKLAGKLLNENKKEAFYDEVLRAIWGYLSDKLTIAQAELNKDNIASELQNNNVDQLLIDEFIQILNTCEFARYAPAESSDTMDVLYNKTVDAMGKMESTFKK